MSNSMKFFFIMFFLGNMVVAICKTFVVVLFEDDSGNKCDVEYWIWFLYMSLLVLTSYRNINLRYTGHLYIRMSQGCPPSSSLFITFMYRSYEHTWRAELVRLVGQFAAECEATGTSKCPLQVGKAFLPQVEEVKYLEVFAYEWGNKEGADWWSALMWWRKHLCVFGTTKHSDHDSVCYNWSDSGLNDSDRNELPANLIQSYFYISKILSALRHLIF